MGRAAALSRASRPVRTGAPGSRAWAARYPCWMPLPDSDPALDTLQRVFGHAAFRGPQAAIIRHVAGGGDALVLMPTGGGK